MVITSSTKSFTAELETANNKAEIGEKRKRFTIDIPAELHTKLKIYAVKKGETMAEIVCNVLEEKLKDA